METHPKRKYSKDNPYRISYDKDLNKYYVVFNDISKGNQKVEISKKVYEAFDSFELEDISQMYKSDKHNDSKSYDETEEIENFIYQNSIYDYKSVEDIIMSEITEKELLLSINALTEVEKRRITMHYFENMTLQEISKIENCSIKNIFKSIDKAKQKLKKFLKNKI